jgi:PPOX class probable F420-dependent enzyme
MSVTIPESARALLGSGRLAHLATISPDGRPHVSIAWAGLDGDEIVIGSMFDQPKLRNIRRDPRVTVSFESDQVDPLGMTECLIVRGRASVTEGGAPELLQHLAATYIGPGIRFPPMEDPPPGFVTRIEIEHIGGLGPWSSEELSQR